VALATQCIRHWRKFKLVTNTNKIFFRHTHLNKKNLKIKVKKGVTNLFLF